MKDLFRQSLAWRLNVASMETAWWQRRLNAMGYVWHMAGLNEQREEEEISPLGGRSPRWYSARRVALSICRPISEAE